MKRIINALIVITVLITCWQLLVWVFHLPHYLLPSPFVVVQKIVEQSDVLLKHAWVTLSEILLGLLFGCFFGVCSALAFTFSQRLSRFCMPVLVLTQAIPVFAIAPLLVLWLGFGMASKVAMAVLIIYFPVVMASYDGLRNTPVQWLQLAESMRASTLTILLKVRLPAALPSLASGLRVAVTFAPIGAVIGEWFGSAEGLGYLMLNANARMRVDMMFAALLVLIIIQLTLFFGVDRLLKKLIPWEGKGS